MDDQEFEKWLPERVAEVPGVLAVALGGSRSRGEQRPDSDWDYALYYRGSFDLDALRRQGWEGDLTEVGGWPGVMNGGGWLQVDGRRVDMHYRDLDEIEHHWAEAREGRFDKQLAQFYLAGMPTYLPLAELALNKVVIGDLPRPEFPEQLRVRAHERWTWDAEWSLRYGMRSLRQRGDVVVAAAGISRSLIEKAHARLAERGEWAVNEKRIVERAGLHDEVAALLTAGIDAETLHKAGQRVSELYDVPLT